MYMHMLYIYRIGLSISNIYIVTLAVISHIFWLTFKLFTFVIVVVAVVAFAMIHTHTNDCVVCTCVCVYWKYAK